MAKRSSSKTPSAPKVPVYLLHGEDDAAMGLEKTRLIGQLVSEEMRAENVAEFAHAGGGVVRLKSVLPDILDELATASFFPEHRRVAVVTDLQELTSKPTKETTALMERLAAFIRDHLGEIGNAAIFVAREDGERWRSVQKQSPLFQAIDEVGVVKHFPTDNLNFALQDALLARDAGECLRILDRRLEQSRASDRLGVLRSVFNDLVKFSRFLIQAKAVRSDQGPGAALPEEKRLNLFEQHQFVQRKVGGAARRFRMAPLVELRGELARANRHFAPSLEDTYVADQRLLLEQLILRMCA